MAKEDLKDLTPEEKLRKLKELEEKKKKEMEEAKEEIKKAEEEITEKAKFKEKVPTKEFAAESFEGLSDEAKEMIKVGRGKKEKEKKEDEEEGVEDLLVDKDEEAKKDLEELTRAERVEIPPEVMQSQYAEQLSEKPMENLYQEMKDIRQAVEEKGYVSAEEERRVEYLTSAVEKKIEAEEAGKYSFTEDVAMAASVTKQLGASLMSAYKSKTSGMYKS